MARITFDLPPHGGRMKSRSDAELVRVLIVADLHGSAKRSEGLGAARIVGLSVDNFEDVMRRVQPTATVVAAGGRRRLTFESMQDFHPDELHAGVLLWGGGTVTAAAPPPAPATPAAPREDDAATLARLLGRPPSEPAPPRPPSVLDAMLRELVAPHIVHGAAPQAPSSEVASIEEVMREVLHAPEFQAVESSWRALRWLVCENPLGAALQVHVLDADRDDLLADLRACAGEIERSALHRLIVDTQAEPFSIVIGDFTVDGSAEDVSLLAGLGATAAKAGACLLAGASPSLWGCDDLARRAYRGEWAEPDPEVAARMALVRASAVAPFIGLCAPRVLARVPYGERSDPVEQFEFTELPDDPPHASFTWINGAFACAQLILAAIAQGAAPGSVLDLGDLPHAQYRMAGGAAIKPCAEVYLDEVSAEQILASGIMPFMSYRDRNAIRLLRLQSIASPPAPLAVRVGATA